MQDFVDVLRTILGQPFLDVLQINSDEQSYQYKVLVKLYEDIVALCSGSVESYLYYACLRLSQVIQQCFDLEDKHTGSI